MQIIPSFGKSRVLATETDVVVASIAPIRLVSSTRPP